ncbi:hypothetical protein NBRC116594_37660 [Shimia sp. NS0008-38b]
MPLSNIQKLTVSLLATLLVTGCSINEFGLIHTEIMQTETASVYVTSAPGIHLDTRDAQPSLTLGHYKATHVFVAPSSEAEEAILPANPFQTQHPHLSASRVVGLQLKSGEGETSFTLGLREHTSLSALDRTQSDCRLIRYLPNNLEQTFLRVSDGGDCFLEL